MAKDDTGRISKPLKTGTAAFDMHGNYLPEFTKHLREIASGDYARKKLGMEATGRLSPPLKGSLKSVKQTKKDLPKLKPVKKLDINSKAAKEILKYRELDKKSRMNKVFGTKLSDERYKQINRLLNANTKTGNTDTGDNRKYAGKFVQLREKLRNDPAQLSNYIPSSSKGQKGFSLKREIELSDKDKKDILKLVRPLEQSGRATTQRKRVDKLKSLIGIKRKPAPTQKSKGPR